MNIPLFKPYITNDEFVALQRTLKSGKLTRGNEVEAFEKEFAQYVKKKFAIAVNSGTSGLHVAVRALGWRKGDEVITTPFSYISSSNALLYENVTPVFVDIDPHTLNIDPSKIENKVEKGDPKNSYIFSFSLGAYLTILLNPKIKFKGYLLCSPSPFFKEDLPKLPDVAKKVMGSNRWEVFQNFKRPSNLQGKATFIIGDGDLPFAIEQTKRMYKGWKGQKKIIILKDVHHDISNDLYISTVLKEIKSISG